MSVLLSKKTKKKLWDDFLKNDRGFVNYYKKTYECNERILNQKPDDKTNIAKQCAEKDRFYRLLWHWKDEDTPLKYNGVNLDVVENVISESTIEEEFRVSSFFSHQTILPKISESDYFEYRPFNLPYVYGELPSNDRVLVYIKGLSERVYKMHPEKKINVFKQGYNRIVFVYYDNSWHPLTANEIYPEPTR